MKISISNIRRSLLFFSVLMIMFGCGIPKNALKTDQNTLKNRTIQTRFFETTDQLSLLAACVSVSQDMGFLINETNKNLGIITGEKETSAVDNVEFGLALLGALTSSSPYDRHTYDKDQKIRISIVVRSKPSHPKKIFVRVTLQRIVRNNFGEITKKVPIKEAKVYRDFFNKLSKAIFLDAHEIQ